MAGGKYGAKGNSVYAGGTPRHAAVGRYKVKTATNLRAGVYVIRDTTDEEIKVAGAGAADIIGVLTERNLSDPDWDPTTAPAVGDEMEVLLLGSGAWAWIRNGANLLAGALLNSSATGRAAAAAVAAAGDIPKVSGKALIDNDGSGTESDILAVI